MSRDLASNTATKFASSHVQPIIFVKLEFDPSTTGTLYLHNGLGTYTWGSQNWLGTGDLGEISAIEEGEQISPYNIRMTLSGLDADITAEAIKQDYYQRPVTIYLGALNDSDSLVATPDIIWTGFMDQMEVVVGGDAGDTIALSCESELAMFTRSRDSLYTNVQQQNASSGDTFFTHLQEMEDLTLDWGRRKSISGGGGTRTQEDYEREDDFRNLTTPQ